MRAIKRYETVAMVAMALVSAAMTAQAADPIGQDDMVFGLSQSYSTTYPRMAWTRWYDASTSTWFDGPGADANEPGWTAGLTNSSWDQQYLQAIEFDNAGSRQHNPNGNLVGVNFGNSYSGFTMYGLSTDGKDNVTTNYTTGNSAGLFSIRHATTGTVGSGSSGAPTGSVTVTKTGGLSTTFNLTERGGGVAFSSRNTKVAWSGYDSGSIFVLDYNAGTTPGTVTVSGGEGTIAGASVSGPRVTALGDRNGNVGVRTALRPSTTTGLTWINDNVVMGFDGTGRLVMWNVANVEAGNMNGPVAGVSVSGASTGFTPNIDAGWKVLADTGATKSFQYSDIEYNPMINPNIIVTSATNNGTFTGEIHLWNFNPITGAVSLNTTLDLPTNYEPREIAFDSQGNLFMSNYSDAKKGITSFVTKLTGASNAANWNLSNVSVFRSETQDSGGNEWYSGYNGMDVASGLIDVRAYGDYNNDEVVDTADYTVWADAFGQTGYFMWADGNADGIVDTADYTVWADNFGLDINTLFTTPSNEALSGSNIPEPTSIGLLAITAAGLLIRRRQA